MESCLLLRLKAAAKKYGTTINEYITAVYTWSIYRAYLHGATSKKPIAIMCPVNLDLL